MRIEEYFADTSFTIPDIYALIQYDFFKGASIQIHGLGVRSTFQNAEGTQWLQVHQPSELPKWDTFQQLFSQITRTQVVLETMPESMVEIGLVPSFGIRYPATLITQKTVNGITDNVKSYGFEVDCLLHELDMSLSETNRVRLRVEQLLESTGILC